MPVPEIDAQTAQTLMELAREAVKNAYAPYSTFEVGAAALCADGQIVSGCNVENASVGLTSCAERTTCCTAVAMGHREIRAIAVTAPRVPTVTPCGACRQVLNEFKPKDSDMIVILDGPTLTQIPLAELLPRAFGPRDLES